ncbi:MAG: zinc-binding dehydrogenase, partial [Duncaniella sp.]|nr:zinc-binding dehydrogenase [Duncaniella sp.]
GVYLTGFYSNFPKQAEITAIMDLIRKSGLHPVTAERFTLDHIAEAHTLAEQRGQIGKIIVTV